MKFYVNGLILYCKPSVEMYHRIGIIASRKVGIAVVRNKFKRHMRELLPAFLAGFQRPYDCVFIAAHSQIASTNFSTLQTNLKALFEKFSQAQYEQTA